MQFDNFMNLHLDSWDFEISMTEYCIFYEKKKTYVYTLVSLNWRNSSSVLFEVKGGTIMYMYNISVHWHMNETLIFKDNISCNKHSPQKIKLLIKIHIYNDHSVDKRDVFIQLIKEHMQLMQM